MSKISLEPNASGAGTFTLAAPNSNTNRTLTLPDESGTIFSDGTGVPGSAVTGQLASSNMPTGSVIQVMQTIKTDVFSATVNAGDSTAVTGLSVNITPSSSNSKILVMTSVSASQSNNRTSSSSPGFTFIRLKRNSTNLGLGDSGGSYQVTAGIAGITALDNYTARVPNTSSHTFLDSPSTTSQITYQVEVGQTRGADNLFYVNRSNDDRGRASSTITVVEIAG